VYTLPIDLVEGILYFRKVLLEYCESHKIRANILWILQ